jgi:carbamoyltransferase
LSDKELLGEYIHQSSNSISSVVDLEKVVDNLIEGKILGLARERSEHGPRALGNRSILCNPAIENMKDILNAKVKNREPYRPFAPVVRLEDLNKFFEWELPSEHMNFSPLVKEEWRDKLASITHIDNTARVQTVTKDQNNFLYELLSLLDKKNGVGVLLNTSFNVAGKPILNSVKDAFHIFQNTEMDNLLIENTYLEKF